MSKLQASDSIPKAADAYLKSFFFEQLIEHAFISEILQEVIDES